MANLVSQSLKILSRAVKETGKEYTSNLTSFMNDARDVKNTIMNTTTDAADTYAKIKRTNITKAIHDWFYQEESDSESTIMGNDEFDAGFGDTGSGSEDSGPKALTADSMINITNKQTNTMIRVARKQTEQSVANTAEIISSLNSRSAEMLTSLNNINKTLLGISSRLDKVIELQSVPIANQNEIDKGGLYQDGKLSLMRIFEQAKSNVLTTGPMSYITPIFDAIRSGTFGPTQLASLGLQFGASKIKVNGKSVDDWGKAFNEMVGTATQTFMNELINTKALRKLLPGLTSMDQADKDYGTVVPNMYDNKRAVFDGMTKMSIINVIPQMLAKINESISGQEYHLDSRGKWIAGPMKNEFNEVTRASFQSSGLSGKLTSSISNAGVQSIGKKIPEKDVTDASEALTMSLVMALHKAGDRSFSASRIKTELAAQISRAVSVLVLLGRGDEAYWTSVCQTIVMQLSSGMMNSAGFVSNVNQSLQRMIDDAANFAQSGKANASQASKLTFDMAANQYLAQHNAPTGTPQVQAAVNNNGTFTSANGNEIVNVSKITGKFSTGQYVGGIFYLLNRGINVRIDNRSSDPYNTITLEQVRADVTPYVSDNTFGKIVAQGLSGHRRDFDEVAESAVKRTLGIGGGDSKGALSKFLDNPAMAIMSLSNFLRGGNGTGGGIGGFVSNLKNRAKGFIGEDRYNAIADRLGGIRDRIAGDDRFIAAREWVGDRVTQGREAAANAVDRIGHSRGVNNAIYRANSARLNAAQNYLDHHVSEDEEDKLRVSIIKGYFSMGAIEDAEEYANQITDKDMRKTVFEMINIHKKRRQGQLDQAAGESPDVGSVLISRPGEEDDGSRVGADESQRSILGRMLGIVGKIAKGVAKMAARGAIDITMGLKSMAQGLLLGYKDTNPTTGETHYNKGLVRNLFTVPLAGMAKGVGKVAKAGVNKIKSLAGGDGIVGKALKGIRGVLNKMLDAVGNIGGWLKDKGSALLDKLKNSAVGRAASAVGGFLNKSKFVRGFTSGFKDAKAAREKLLGEKKRSSARDENPLQADQVDMIEGSKPSIFSKMHDVVSNIWSKLNEQVDYTKMSYEETHERNEVEERRAEQEQQRESSPDIDTVTEDGPRRRESAGHPGDAGDSSNGGGGIKGVLGSIGSVIGDVFGNFGKMMGGMMQALMGIGEMVISIVTSLEAFGALKDLVQSILTDGLQPLNEAFEAVIEAIKPIVAVLKETVKSIAEVVVTIAKSLIDAVQPILETLMPIIKTVIDFLSPILDIIKVLMDVIMVPIKITLDILSPVVEGIGYTLQVVSGVLQVGLGAIMGLLGAVVGGLGIILSFMPGSVGKKGDELKETGENMLEMSKNMLKAGAEQVKQGIQGGLALIQRLLPGGEDGKKDEEETEETTTDNRKATLANDFGAGDAPSTTINNNWSYTFGSGNTNTTMNQHSYGGYMNMSERGCGPVALADAFGRRGGGNINPANLAAAMTGAGTYDPRRGTSVSSMINTGNAMGMGMRLGGVTAASLSQSSPTNPITVLGSGTGFGTHSGNNHYVNVVGTDGHGGAYVSNPMTGRVEKHATSNLVLNSKLGLYGSGDNDLEEYGFSDEAYDSLERLKNITSRLTDMFTGESDAEKKISDANLEQKAKEIKRTLGDDYDAIEQQVLNELKSKYPDLSDTQIQRKLNGREGWKLIVQYGGGAAVDLYNSNALMMKTGINDAVEGYNSISDRIKAMTTASQDANNSTSITGAIMTPFTPINFTEPYLNQESVTFEDGETIQSGEIVARDKNGGGIRGYYGSPVHDFFNSTLVRDNFGSNLIYTSEGWFDKFYAQNKEGVGSTGPAHEGALFKVDFRKGNHVVGLPAITGGTVTYVTTDEDSNGLGKSVKWRDTGGMYHWYMNMSSIGKNIEEGANVEPGQLIGYQSTSIGNTGETKNYSEPTFRYVVTSAGPQGNTGDAGFINPFTYWQFKASSDGLFGDTEKEQIFNYFTEHFGFSPAAAAGIMGVLGCEGMLEPEPYSAQMEGYFGEGKDERSKQYKTLQSMNDYALNVLFPAYDRQGTDYSRSGYYSDGLYLPGIGIAQWTAGRTRGLFDYAKSQDNDWWDLQTQLDFIEAEKGDVFESMFKQIGNSSSPREAADIWMTQYEAGGSGSDPWSTWLKGRDGQGAAIIARRNKADAIYKEVMANFVNKDHSASSSDTGGIRTGKFIGSVTNPEAFGGNTDDIFQSAAQVFSSYYDADGLYYLDGRDWGTLTLSNGTQIEHLRPDCSGMMSAVIRNMGYTLNGVSDTGFRTGDWIGKVSNNTIYKNGLPTTDWQFMNYDGKELKPGDIMISPGHTGMYVWGDNNSSWGNRGFDGGATDGIENSALAGKDLLGGKSDWKSKLAWTISAADTGDDKIKTILRYTGKSINNNINGSSQAGGLTFSTGTTYESKKSGEALSKLDAIVASGISWSDLTKLYDEKKLKEMGIVNVNGTAKLQSQITRKEQAVAELNDAKKAEAANKETWFETAWNSTTDGFGDNFSRGWSDIWGGIKKAVGVDTSQSPAHSSGGGSASGGIHASGDVSNSWYDALFGNNNIETVSNYVPPLDESKLYDEENSGMAAVQNMVNRFNIRSSDSKTTDMLDRMSNMTFNVRAERVEQLLEILISKVGSTGTSDGPLPDLFEEGIPEAVTRLSIG